MMASSSVTNQTVGPRPVNGIKLEKLWWPGRVLATMSHWKNTQVSFKRNVSAGQNFLQFQETIHEIVPYNDCTFSPTQHANFYSSVGKSVGGDVVGDVTEGVGDVFGLPFSASIG